MPKPRLVLDTSAVLMPIVRENSSESWLREMWRNGQIIPLISSDRVSELIETLRKPHFEAGEEQAVAIYFRYCVEVEIPNPPPETPICRDPNDQPFLILAYHAAADYLVTKDPDLLALRDESEIPIITPAELSVIMPRYSSQRDPI